MLKGFIKDMAQYSPSQFLPAITAFITIPILTRLFQPAEYGYWAQASNISAFLVALAVSGIGSAVIRFYPAYKAKYNLHVFYTTLYVTVSAVLIIVTGLGFLTIFAFKSSLPSVLVQLLPLIILIFIAQSLFSVFSAMFRAQERSGLYTSFQLLTFYIGLGLGLFLVIALGFGIEGLLWGTYIAIVLSLPFMFFLVTKDSKTHLKYFNLTDAFQIWQYAWPLMISNMAMWGLRVSDLFIIGQFRPAQEVGIYSVSYNISSKSIELLVALFLLSVSPIIYRTWENEGKEATEKALSLLTRLYLLLCLPAAVGVSVLAYPFVTLLTSPDYYEGYKIVAYVVFSSFVWGLANIAMMGLTIKKQARRIGANSVIASTLHIGLQVFLVPRFGYIASAISTLIGYSILLVLHTQASRSFLTWGFPFSSLRNVTFASIIMGLVAWGINVVSYAGSKASPLFLFLGIFAAVPVYGIALWLLGEVNESEKIAIKQFLNRIRRKPS